MRFSIVTPSFKQLEWLRLCIASVRDQAEIRGQDGVLRMKGEGSDFFPSLEIEHIIQDAGTLEIEGFAREHGAVFYQDGKEVFSEQCFVNDEVSPGYILKVNSEKDTGMYDAINKGLRSTQGDICSYLNCDEQLLPGALRIVRRYFDQNPHIDVVFGDTIVVGKDGAPLCYWRPYVPNLYHLSGATLNTLTCSTFFRRRIVDAGSLFEPQWKVVGDLRWIRQLLEKGHPMACLPVPLATFTYLGDNLGSGSKAKEEFEVSRENYGRLSRWLRRSVHAIRKLLSGAYVQRKVAFEIFTLPDPLQRKRFTSERLGWIWPNHT